MPIWLLAWAEIMKSAEHGIIWAAPGRNPGEFPTFITRLARNRVPLSHAMRLVNHASTTIHRVYQRLGVEDVREIPSMFTGLNAGDGKQKSP